MTLASLSALGIVTAAVVFILAFLSHVAEWATLRGVDEGASVAPVPAVPVSAAVPASRLFGSALHRSVPGLPPRSRGTTDPRCPMAPGRPR